MMANIIEVADGKILREREYYDNLSGPGPFASESV